MARRTPAWRLNGVRKLCRALRMLCSRTLLPSFACLRGTRFIFPVSCSMRNCRKSHLAWIPYCSLLAVCGRAFHRVILEVCSPSHDTEAEYEGGLPLTPNLMEDHAARAVCLHRLATECGVCASGLQKAKRSTASELAHQQRCNEVRRRIGPLRPLALALLSQIERAYMSPRRNQLTSKTPLFICLAWNNTFSFRI